MNQQTYHAVIITTRLESISQPLLQSWIVFSEIPTERQMLPSMASNQVAVVDAEEGAIGLPAWLPVPLICLHVADMIAELIWNAIPSCALLR